MLPIPSVAIGLRDPKSLVRNRLAWRRFWTLFIRCNKADEGCEISLPSFPSPRVMFSQEMKGREPGAARRAAVPAHSGVNARPGHLDRREAGSALWQEGRKIPHPSGSCSKAAGQHLHPDPLLPEQEGWRVELV